MVTVLKNTFLNTAAARIPQSRNAFRAARRPPDAISYAKRRPRTTNRRPNLPLKVLLLKRKTNFRKMQNQVTVHINTIDP